MVQAQLNLQDVPPNVVMPVTASGHHHHHHNMLREPVSDSNADSSLSGFEFEFGSG